jgi:hypothetical protein
LIQNQKNEMIVFSAIFEVLDIAKTKFDISNQLCDLKEIFVHRAR